MTDYDWNIAVFCRNEEPYIEQTLTRIAAAIGDHDAALTVIVNGSTDRSAALAQETTRRLGLRTFIYTIAYGDKANAINQFYYRIRADARLYFFVDGYAKVGPNAFRAMDDCLTNRPEIVATTGVAVNGRTMHLATERTLASQGLMHGQLHGLRRAFLDRLNWKGIRMPIGLYYGDGLLGSMAMHDLDPVYHPWEPARIAGLAEATYEIPALSITRPRDLKRQFNRKIRQMRGRLENAAIRDLVYREGYEGLPEFSDELIAAFLAKRGVPPVPGIDRLFMHLALKQHRAFHRPDPATLEPVLISGP